MPTIGISTTEFMTIPHYSHVLIVADMSQNYTPVTYGPDSATLYQVWIPSGNLTQHNIATENGHLCMIYLLHMVIVHSYVKLPEGTAYRALTIWDAGHPKRLRSWMVAWATPHGCSAQTLGVPAGSARFFFHSKYGHPNAPKFLIQKLGMVYS